MSIRATVGTIAKVPRSLDGANLTQGTARIAPEIELRVNFYCATLNLPVASVGLNTLTS